MRLSRKTKIGWNTAFLLSAVFFLVVLYGFTYQQSFIDKLGTSVTSTYVDYHREREHQRFPLNKALTRFYAEAHEVPVVEAGENIDG